MKKEGGLFTAVFAVRADYIKRGTAVGQVSGRVAYGSHHHLLLFPVSRLLPVAFSGTQKWKTRRR